MSALEEPPTDVRFTPKSGRRRRPASVRNARQSEHLQLYLRSNKIFGLRTHEVVLYFLVLSNLRRTEWLPSNRSTSFHCRSRAAIQHWTPAFELLLGSRSKSFCCKTGLTPSR